MDSVISMLYSFLFENLGMFYFYWICILLWFEVKCTVLNMIHDGWTFIININIRQNNISHFFSKDKIRVTYPIKSYLEKKGA